MDSWKINRATINSYKPREVIHFWTLGRLKWYAKYVQNASIILKASNKVYLKYIQR